jgi:hypothetical protein
MAGAEVVRRAEDGAAAWRDVVHVQTSAEPDHADFYALAGEMVDTLSAIESLAGVLTRQVARYGDGRAIYDDTRTVDPRERLMTAADELRSVRDAAHIAQRAPTGSGRRSGTSGWR